MSEHAEPQQEQSIIAAETAALHEFADSESWRLARKFLKPLGPPHGLFSRCIRSLRKPQVLELTPEHWKRFYANNLDLIHLYRSANIRAILYYAARTFHEQELSDIKELDGGSLVALFSPAELSAVVATAYLYRHVRKIIDKDLWELVTGECELQMETGMWVGKHIPEIGTDRGLLVGAARFFGSLLYSKIDPKGFRQLRRELNKTEKLFDLTAEEHEWGCNHLQISALLLQSYGFGIGAAQGLLSLEHTLSAGAELSQEAKRWYAAMVWIRAVLEDEKAPVELQGDSVFIPSPETFAKLQRHVDDINERGASFDWITKSGSDLPAGIEEQIRSIRPKSAKGVAQTVVPPADEDPEQGGPEIL